MTNTLSQLGLFLGRFHPLLVHLPIGFLVLLLVLGFLTFFPRFQRATDCTGLILVLTLPVAALSALCGWLLAQGGGYDAELLRWHRWTGVALVATIVVAFALHRLHRLAAYRVWLLVTATLLVLASHEGGSLTHGRDYLTRYAAGLFRSAPAKRPSSPASTTTEQPTNRFVYAAAVSPVLDRYCVGCHGPEKSSAALRLDSFDGLLKGGEAGPAIVPGQSKDSHLVLRTALPPSHDDHMPPDGKPQPAADDLALLRWWIDAGAPRDRTVEDLKPPEEIRRLLHARVSPASTLEPPAPAPSTSAPPLPRAEAVSLADRLLGELPISISALSAADPWLQANASVAGRPFGDAELARLAPLKLNVRWLDLAGTRTTDTGLVQVAEMKNLTRLHLERTPVSDAGLARLSGLTELEYLNLYGTEVSDAGLDHLKGLKKLRQIYLWQTKVTPEGAKAFADAIVDRPQIQQWQQQIADLQDRIRKRSFAAELGIPVVAAIEFSLRPINLKCPVSGKDIDPAITLSYQGKVVAFCCTNCQASFEKDPKPLFSF